LGIFRLERTVTLKVYFPVWASPPPPPLFPTEIFPLDLDPFSASLPFPSTLLLTRAFLDTSSLSKNPTPHCIPPYLPRSCFCLGFVFSLVTYANLLPPLALPHRSHRLYDLCLSLVLAPDRGSIRVARLSEAVCDATSALSMTLPSSNRQLSSPGFPPRLSIPVRLRWHNPLDNRRLSQP